MPLTVHGNAGNSHSAVSHEGCSCGCDENSTSCCCSMSPANSGVSFQSCSPGLSDFTATKLTDFQVTRSLFAGLAQRNRAHNFPVFSSSIALQEVIRTIDHPPSLTSTH